MRVANTKDFTYKVVAFDKAGNSAETTIDYRCENGYCLSRKRLAEDTYPPKIIFRYDENRKGYAVNASDFGSAVKEVRIYEGKTLVDTLKPAFGSNEVDIWWKKGQTGKQYVVRASDLASNESSTE